MVDVKRGIMDPMGSNSLVLFILGSVIAGFAAGLGWGLASKLIEGRRQEELMMAAQQQGFRARARRAMNARRAFLHMA